MLLNRPKLSVKSFAIPPKLTKANLKNKSLKTTFDICIINIQFDSNLTLIIQFHDKSFVVVRLCKI